MKQMNKEEIIEFFIEQLGDNEIIGKIMSVEQIRKKLNYIIKDVTYRDDIVSFSSGFWHPEPDGRGTLNFNPTRIKTFKDYKIVIVHEVLHALSSKITLLRKSVDRECEFEEINIKCGLKISKNVHYFKDEIINVDEEQNFAINEGMTDTLTEMITGTLSNSYSTEKDIYKILSIIVGEDNMLKEYFSENISEEKSPLDIFKEDLIEKYGEFLGNNINEDLKKVLILSDQLLNSEITSCTCEFTKMSKIAQDKIKNELYDALENIVCELIEFERLDIMTKIDDILVLLTSLNGKVSTKILRTFFENEIMSIEEKQSMAHSILKKYFESHIRSKKDWGLIFDLYMKSGNITQQMWYKKPILKNIIEQDKPETIDDMSDKINKIKYRQVGDYYMILCDNKYQYGGQREILNGKIFNKDGMELQESTLWSSLSKPNDIEFYKIILEGKFGISQEQDISNLMEQLNGKAKELKNKVLPDKQDKDNNDYVAISSIGNLLKIHYITNLEKDENIYYEFYSVDSNGLLQLVELRRRTKIY